MDRTSIQQFRAALGDGARQSGPIRAYRELTRRPAPTAPRVEWAAWPPVAASGTAQAIHTLVKWSEWPPLSEREARA